MYYCRIKHSGLLKNRFAYFQIGLIVALTFVFFAFNIESERKVYDKPIEDDPYVWVEIDPETIRTAEKKKELPPPPKSTQKIIMPVEELPVEPVQKAEPVEIVKEVSEFVVAVAPKEVVVAKVVTPEPKPEPVELPPEPVEVEPDVIHRFVTEMPTFPGCEDSDEATRKQCAEQKMMAYIYRNIKYPAIAVENGIEGVSHIQFVVDKDGSITNIKPLTKVGGGCTKEAVRVLKGMPVWNPGKQKGKPVKVYFTMPVSFTLK